MPCYAETESGCKAIEGTEVSFNPYKGGHIASITVKDADGVEIATTDKEDESYSFTMPTTDVTISASLEKIRYSINIDSDKIKAYLWPDTTKAVTKAVYGDSLLITTANDNYGIKQFHFNNKNGYYISNIEHSYEVGTGKFNKKYTMPDMDVYAEFQVDTVYKLINKSEDFPGIYTYFSNRQYRQTSAFEGDSVRYTARTESNIYKSIDTAYCVAGTDTLPLIRKDDESFYFAMPTKPVSCEAIPALKMWKITKNTGANATITGLPDSSAANIAHVFTVTPKSGYYIKEVSYKPSLYNEADILYPDDEENFISSNPTEYSISMTSDSIQVYVVTEKIPDYYSPVVSFIISGLVPGAVYSDVFQHALTSNTTCLRNNGFNVWKGTKSDENLLSPQDTLEDGVQYYAEYSAIAYLNQNNCHEVDNIRDLYTAAQAHDNHLRTSILLYVNGQYVDPDTALVSMHGRDSLVTMSFRFPFKASWLNIENKNDKVFVYNISDSTKAISKAGLGDSIVITTKNPNYGIKDLTFKNKNGDTLYPSNFDKYSDNLLKTYLMPNQDIVIEATIDTVYKLTDNESYRNGSVINFSSSRYPYSQGYAFENDTLTLLAGLNGGYIKVDSVYCKTESGTTLALTETSEQFYKFVMPKSAVTCEAFGHPQHFKVTKKIEGNGKIVGLPDSLGFNRPYGFEAVPDSGYYVKKVLYQAGTDSIIDLGIDYAHAPDVSQKYEFSYAPYDTLTITAIFEKIPEYTAPTFRFTMEGYAAGDTSWNRNVKPENSCVSLQSLSVFKDYDNNVTVDRMETFKKDSTYMDAIYVYLDITKDECKNDESFKSINEVIRASEMNITPNINIYFNGEKADASAFRYANALGTDVIALSIWYTFTAEAKTVKIVHSVMDRGKITGLPELATVGESVKFTVVPDSGFAIARVEFTSDAIDSNVVLKPADASKFDPSKSTEYAISSIPNDDVNVWVYFRKLFSGESPAFEFTLSNTEEGTKSVEFEMLSKNSCLDVTTSNIYKGTSISSANMLKGSDTFKAGETYTAAYTFNANLDGDCGKDANLTTARDMLEAKFLDSEYKPNMKITVNGKEVAFDSIWNGGGSTQSYVTFNLKYTFTATEAKEAIMVMAAKPQFNVTTAGRNLLISGARAGSTYAILDMQGRVMQRGTVNAANFEVAAPRAGSYLVRIGNQMQRVNVK